MTTVVFRVDPAQPELGPIRQAATVLRAGGLVAFPTETVYGLGANALDSTAVGRIFTAKGRPANNPLIVHVADVPAARQLVSTWPAAATALAARFWPGPLTFVLSKNPGVPDVVTAGGPTVAIRCPAHPVAQALLRACKVPLAAPSANRSAHVSPTTGQHVFEDLGDRIEMILDGGPTPGGLESTVLDLTTSPGRLLRPGLVPPSDIEAVIGPIERGAEPGATPPRSPGLQARHYAPLAPLECFEGDAADRVQSLLRAGHKVGWLTQRQVTAPADAVVVMMPDESSAYAARLYAELRRLDAAGVGRIVVELPPATEPWLAVRDRLSRAGKHLAP